MDWFQEIDKKALVKIWGTTDSLLNSGVEEMILIDKPSSFTRRSVDKITNFRPSVDTLKIDSLDFGIHGSATYAIGANKRVVENKLARQNFDFLYDLKKGGLYFNENGADKGFGDGGIIAVLKGSPNLMSANINFI